MEFTTGQEVMTKTGKPAIVAGVPFVDVFGVECVRIRSVKDGKPVGSARVVHASGLTPAVASVEAPAEVTPEERCDVIYLAVNANALADGVRQGEPVSLGTIDRIIELATAIKARHEPSPDVTPEDHDAKPWHTWDSLSGDERTEARAQIDWLAMDELTADYRYRKAWGCWQATFVGDAADAIPTERDAQDLFGGEFDAFGPETATWEDDEEPAGQPVPDDYVFVDVTEEDDSV